MKERFIKGEIYIGKSEPTQKFADVQRWPLKQQHTVVYAAAKGPISIANYKS